MSKMQKILILCICSLLLAGCVKDYLSLDLLGDNSGTETAITKAIANKGQILLRNDYKFTTGQKSYGASAFTITRNGKYQVVTAKHLLGSAMSIEPAIHPNDLQNKLLSWQFLRPKQRDPIWQVSGISFINDHPLQDFIIFDIQRSARGSNKHNIQALYPASQQLKKGELAYVVACPYQEKSCEQNFYPLIMDDIDPAGGMMLIFQGKAPEPSGFSGAPIINQRGEYVGLLTADINKYVMAQSLL